MYVLTRINRPRRMSITCNIRIYVGTFFRSPLGRWKNTGPHNRIFLELQQYRIRKTDLYNFTLEGIGVSFP